MHTVLRVKELRTSLLHVAHNKNLPITSNKSFGTAPWRDTAIKVSPPFQEYHFVVWGYIDGFLWINTTGTPGSRKGYVPYTLRTATLGAIVLLCLLCIGALEYLIHSKALMRRGPLVSHLRPRQNELELGFPPLFTLTLPDKTLSVSSQVVIRDPQIAHTETNGRTEPSSAADVADFPPTVSFVHTRSDEPRVTAAPGKILSTTAKISPTGTYTHTIIALDLPSRSIPVRGIMAAVG